MKGEMMQAQKLPQINKNEYNKPLIDFEKLPLGQRLRRLGYRVIVDMDKELHCENVLNKKMDEESNKLRQKFEKAIHPCCVIIEKRKIDFYGDAFCILKVTKETETFLSIGQNYEEQTERYSCKSKIAKMDEYIHDDIPIGLYQKVEKAKEDGLKDFFVAYPVIEKVKQTDPILFAKLGDEMIFIGQWE